MESESLILKIRMRHTITDDVVIFHGNENAHAELEAELRRIVSEMTTGKAILVWRFDEAPQELQEMSNNGGDEDWVALVPPHLAGEYIGWIEKGGPFGCFCVDEYDWNGHKVYIGAHG